MFSQTVAVMINVSKPVKLRGIVPVKKNTSNSEAMVSLVTRVSISKPLEWLTQLVGSLISFSEVHGSNFALSTTQKSLSYYLQDSVTYCKKSCTSSS